MDKLVLRACVCLSKGSSGIVAGLCSVPAAPAALGLRAPCAVAKAGAQCLSAAISLPQQFCPGAGLGLGRASNGPAGMESQAFPAAAPLALPRCLLELQIWAAGKVPCARDPDPGCPQGFFPSLCHGRRAAFGAGIPNCSLLTEGELPPTSDTFGEHTAVLLSPGTEQRNGLWARRGQGRSLEICAGAQSLLQGQLQG